MTSLLLGMPPTKISEEPEWMVVMDLLRPIDGPQEEIDEPYDRER